MAITITKYLRYLVIPLAAFLGGFVAQMVMHPSDSFAAGGASAPMFFMGDDGQVRLQMGTYTAPGERGLPLVGLSDNHGRLRMLFRLAGGNESPVIIMKDTNGRDRVVFGLGLNDAAQAPFLSIVDANGTQRNVFGQY